MSTWIIGDIHGCAEELRELLGRLQLGPEDRVATVGDLFHRGPDAWGVAQALRDCGAQFVLGNHELAVLRRVGLAPTQVDGADRPPLRTSFPPIALDDLVGDGRRSLSSAPEHFGELLIFLQGHAGFALSSRSSADSAGTKDGRAFVIVHAGIPPGRDPFSCRPEDLVYPPRGAGRRAGFWYETYGGPDLVLFGHLPNPEPIERRVDGQPLALGLDTGCVYGGHLTAYCPEQDRFERVRARRAYARP